MRWRQDKDTGEFVPMDAAAAKHDGHFVIGDIEPFRSPIDGEVITDRKQYREHCEKHGVVPASEFSAEHYAKKAQEREDFFNRKRSPQEERRNKMDAYEALMKAERERGW